MSQNPEMPLPLSTSPGVTACANCHSPMPSELRFCRNCGFRLGEGLAEYNETVRFQGGSPGIPMGGVPATCKKSRRRMSGMTWMFMGLLVFFVAAAAFTALVAPLRHASNIQFTVPVPPRSYVGVNSFDTTAGGVTFDYVEAPGTPADKAGLVGGDVITMFDGQSINSDDEMMSLLGRTPIGKTVDVVYMRDGETKTIKVNSILQSRPADLAGIKQGDIITDFDGTPIRTPEELRARVRRALPYSTVKVVVMRGNERLEIPVKMGKQ